MSLHSKPFIAVSTASSLFSKPRSIGSIKKNVKYGSVKSVVETGGHKVSLEESLSLRRFKKTPRDELFRRMKVSTFVSVIIDQYKHFEKEKGGASDQGVNKGTCTVSRYSAADSSFSQLITGVGEMDIKTDSQTLLESKVRESPAYLLLDVRSQEEYMNDHIITAKHYPHTMVKRAFNDETADLVDFKNKQEKFILVYDQNEVMSSNVCNSLAQRGYDNVYLLSGGLSRAIKRFPKGLTMGSSKHYSLEKIVGGLPRATGGHCGCNRRNYNPVSLAVAEEFHEKDIETLQLYLDECYGTVPKNNLPPNDSIPPTKYKNDGQNAPLVYENHQMTKAIPTKKVPWK